MVHNPFTRRGFMTLMAGFPAVLAVGGGFPVGAEVRQRYFRIGTGPVGGVSFPLGSLLATAISMPPGARPCERGGSCGVPGLIAVAQSTGGSIQNIGDIVAGRVEAALVHGDLAYWAGRGENPFTKEGRVEGLRLIGNLFVEVMHLVVSAESGIGSIGDLRRRRISLGEAGSLTRRNAQVILGAHGVRPRDIRALSQSTEEAAAALSAGSLDGFFLLGVAPDPVLAALAEHTDIALVPITDPAAGALLSSFPYFAFASLPNGTYTGVSATPTVGVPVQWLVSSRADADLIYGVTQALWHPNTARLLATGNGVARQVALDTALTTTGVPLHPGAERFYREKGLVNGAPVLP